MEDWHRPTYWLKTVRIIRCINDVLTEEIHLFMTENFLKYETSFIASTSEFWLYEVCNNTFDACIGTFMANRHTFNNGIFFCLRHNNEIRIQRCTMIPKAKPCSLPSPFWFCALQKISHRWERCKLYSFNPQGSWLQTGFHWNSCGWWWLKFRKIC